MVDIRNAMVTAAVEYLARTVGHNPFLFRDLPEPPFRRSDIRPLSTGGYIEKVGITYPNRTLNRTRVWRLTARGIRVSGVPEDAVPQEDPATVARYPISEDHHAMPYRYRVPEDLARRLGIPAVGGNVGMEEEEGCA